jgi:hypothetical protein
MKNPFTKEVTVLGIVDDKLFIAPIFAGDSIHTATIDDHNKSYLLAAGVVEFVSIGDIVDISESEMSNL